MIVDYLRRVRFEVEKMAVSAELMERLKACELEMLKVFIEICDQLNLKYYLVEGTLLGAVRHKGFIPWDDDIDVAMPRADYERFLKEAPPILPQCYCLQSVYSESEYSLCFAKIRDSRTTFIQTCFKDRKMNHGVYIDVFPLDYVIGDRGYGVLFRKILRFRAKICEFRISQMLTKQMPKATLLKRVKRKVVGIFAASCYPQLEQATMAREKLYAARSNGNFVTNYGSMYGDREIMPVEWYGDGVYLEFEGLLVRVPTEYDKWLRQVYGDYMQLPPPEKRIAQHCTEVIDLDEPYTEYMEELNNIEKK